MVCFSIQNSAQCFAFLAFILKIYLPRLQVRPMPSDMPEKEKKAPEQGSLRCRFKRLCSLHYYTRGKHKVNYLYSQCRAIPPGAFLHAEWPDSCLRTCFTQGTTPHVPARRLLKEQITAKEYPC
jgi:hypothetical protein